MALSTVRSTGSRTRPASASRLTSSSGAREAGTWVRVRGTPGSRSFQMRTHLPGITPGAYTSRNEEGTSEPVTWPGYRPWSAVVHTLDTLGSMTSHQNTQTMKPATAAKKLGVYLEATHAEFREGVVSRAELNALQAYPPQWLRDLRRDGPHPRPVVTAKLGVSIAGLGSVGVTEPLTTEQIEALKQESAQLLERERDTQAGGREGDARVKDRDAERAAGQRCAGRPAARTPGAGNASPRHPCRRIEVSTSMGRARAREAQPTVPGVRHAEAHVEAG